MAERSAVRLTATLDSRLSRWLWLVKWILALPHYFVLVFLWIAFFVLTVVAFFAILFTGRYPHTIFEFNVGVLRWTWRVSYYAYGALGTDRYPPFTLHDVPDYPARLDIAPPQRLSRGLVLVKWWLLAIPHYLVVAFFTGPGIEMASGTWEDSGPALDWGLIGLLVLFAAVALLFSARYPRGVFDFVLGMQRWVYRVVAYAALMTDVYPPFRLDQGGDEPASTRDEPAAGAVEAKPPAAKRPARWSAGPVFLMAAGALAAALALGTLAAAVAITAVDRSRGSDGYLSTDLERASGAGYALVSEEAEIRGEGVEFLRDFLGTVRITARDGKPLFVGIGPRAEVERYLSGVPYERITHTVFSRGDERDLVQEGEPGATAPPRPELQPFWAAKTAGPGTQQLTWDVREGEWTVVVMNADASPGITADLRLGATLPGISGIATGLYVATVVLLGLGAILIVLSIRLARPE
ncbi:DUF4389 domain-containing protein [Actinocorallia sp. B10E7]|uniref:DUF4389 domain-containing protein n=1 Tax=Actinocorallia sp. B10E7 TaxID=3153558 RepID=UPI00325EA11F